MSFPVTQKSVLNTLSETVPKSFSDLLYEFLLDKENQYIRLEKTLEKLHMQRKIDVIKNIGYGAAMFPADWQKGGSMFRFYSFIKVKV